MGPIVMAILLVVFRALPCLSPAGYEVQRFPSAYAIVQVAFVAFFAVVFSSALLAAVGLSIPVGRVTSIALAGLLGVLGTQAPKLKRNFFIGIRTPWALTHDDNWAATHQMAGRLLMLAGALSLVSAVFGIPDFVVLGGMALPVVGSAAYSFALSVSRPASR